MDKPDKIGFEFIDIKERLLAEVRYFQKQKIWIRRHLKRLHLNVCLPGRYYLAMPVSPIGKIDWIKPNDSHKDVSKSIETAVASNIRSNKLIISM